MICSIHQPNFLPYLAFFDKIKKSDVFVIYDDAQFCRRDFHHQNYILINGNPMRLRVPVEECHINTPINLVKINKNGVIRRHHWKDYHLLNLVVAYHKSPNFAIVYPLIVSIYRTEFDYLVNFNISLINLFLRLLGISKPVMLSSKLSKKNEINSKSTQKLIDLTKAVYCDSYLSGVGAKDYLNEELFKKQNIGLTYNNFIHPVYPQIKSKEFVKNMCILDYLFNTQELLCNTSLLQTNY